MKSLLQSLGVWRCSPSFSQRWVPVGKGFQTYSSHLLSFSTAISNPSRFWKPTQRSLNGNRLFFFFLKSLHPHFSLASPSPSPPSPSPLSSPSNVLPFVPASLMLGYYLQGLQDKINVQELFIIAPKSNGPISTLHKILCGEASRACAVRLHATERHTNAKISQR